MTEAQVRSSLAPHVEGMFLAAASLVMLMDHEDMTLEKLRRSPPAQQFRNHVLAFRHWIEDAIGSLPENMFPPEEKRMLEYWMRELDRGGTHALAVVRKTGDVPR